MHPYIDKEDIERRCKDPKFCIACFRTQEIVKVDEHHVCEECREGSTGTPRRLPAITLKNGKTYFVDDRLKELRNIHDPSDRIDFKDPILSAPEMCE